MQACCHGGTQSALHNKNIYIYIHTHTSCFRIFVLIFVLAQAWHVSVKPPTAVHTDSHKLHRLSPEHGCYAMLCYATHKSQTLQQSARARAYVRQNLKGHSSCGLCCLPSMKGLQQLPRPPNSTTQPLILTWGRSLGAALSMGQLQLECCMEGRFRNQLPKHATADHNKKASGRAFQVLKGSCGVDVTQRLIRFVQCHLSI